MRNAILLGACSLSALVAPLMMSDGREIDAGGGGSAADLVGAVTQAGADAGHESRELAHVEAAEAAAAIAYVNGTDPADEEKRVIALRAADEIAATKIADLPAKLEGAALLTLRLALAGEASKGSQARAGAIKLLEAAIDAHPEHQAVLARADAAINQGNGTVTDAATLGGAVDLSHLAVDAGGPADPVPPVQTPDRLAELVDQEDPAEELARPDGSDMLEDISDEVDAAELRDHVMNRPSLIALARRNGVHREISPIRVEPGEFVPAHDGRLLYTGTIALTGVGLAEPLAIEEAWLVIQYFGAPAIVRRCEIASELHLAPGRQVGFPARSLIF